MTILPSLMSALMESVGGATRIILAHNSTTGGGWHNSARHRQEYLGQCRLIKTDADATSSGIRPSEDQIRIMVGSTRLQNQ